MTRLGLAVTATVLLLAAPLAVVITIRRLDHVPGFPTRMAVLAWAAVLLNVWALLDRLDLP